MHTIELQKTIITKDGREIARLELRDANIGDVEQAAKEKMVISQDLNLLARLAQDLTPEDVRQLHPKDFAKCRDFLRSFLE